MEPDLAQANESHWCAAHRADAAEQAMAPVIEKFATKVGEIADHAHRKAANKKRG